MLPEDGDSAETCRSWVTEKYMDLKLYIFWCY